MVPVGTSQPIEDKLRAWFDRILRMPKLRLFLQVKVPMCSSARQNRPQRTCGKKSKIGASMFAKRRSSLNRPWRGRVKLGGNGGCRLQPACPLIGVSTN